MRDITVGISDETYVEVKSGLEEGELVLSSGLQRVIELRRAQKEATGRPQMPKLPMPMKKGLK